jgi:hypothetical protein
MGGGIRRSRHTAPSRGLPLQPLHGGLPGILDELRGAALVKERLIKNVDPRERCSEFSGQTTCNLKGVNREGDLVERVRPSPSVLDPLTPEVATEGAMICCDHHLRRSLVAPDLRIDDEWPVQGRSHQAARKSVQLELQRLRKAAGDDQVRVQVALHRFGYLGHDRPIACSTPQWRRLWSELSVLDTKACRSRRLHQRARSPTSPRPRARIRSGSRSAARMSLYRVPGLAPKNDSTSSPHAGAGLP